MELSLVPYVPIPEDRDPAGLAGVLKSGVISPALPASQWKGTHAIGNLLLAQQMRRMAGMLHDRLSAAGAVCGYRCFQKVVWAKQVAPNMSDMEGPQRFIAFSALKVWTA